MEEGQTDTTTLETCLAIFTEAEIRTTHDPAIPLLQVQPIEEHAHGHQQTYTRMFPGACVTQKRQNAANYTFTESKCPTLAGTLIDSQGGYVHTGARRHVGNLYIFLSILL